MLSGPAVQPANPAGTHRVIQLTRKIFYILIYMKSILVQLDDETMAQLEQVAPAKKRARTEFIRQAIKSALHRNEFDLMREAYLKQPQELEDGGDWDDPLEWNPEAAAK